MNKKTDWNGPSILNKKDSLSHPAVVGWFLALLLILFPYSLHSELKADKTVFDFNSIKEGVNVPVWFTLINSGDKPIKIKEIRTFAACVQSRPVKDMVLEPGENVRLDFVFESLGYGGVTINKPIEIHHDEPKKNPLRLRVKGKISPLEDFQAPIGEVTYNYLVLLDIRSPEKYKKEHVLGAINVPYEKLFLWAQNIKKGLPRQVLIYIYSEKGVESDRAVQELRKQGHQQFVSVVGGFQEWKRRYKEEWIISGSN